MRRAGGTSSWCSGVALHMKAACEAGDHRRVALLRPADVVRRDGLVFDARVLVQLLCELRAVPRLPGAFVILEGPALSSASFLSSVPPGLSLLFEFSLSHGVSVAHVVFLSHSRLDATLVGIEGLGKEMHVFTLTVMVSIVTERTQ